MEKKKTVMNYRILEASSASELQTQVRDFCLDGWEPVGPHQVREVDCQLVYSGNQHKRTTKRYSWSQTMVRVEPTYEEMNKALKE